MSPRLQLSTTIAVLVLLSWVYWSNRQPRVFVEPAEEILTFADYRWFGVDYYLLEWKDSPNIDEPPGAWYIKPQYRELLFGLGGPRPVNGPWQPLWFEGHFEEQPLGGPWPL